MTMQIPPEWFVYILPGIVIIASCVLVLDKDRRGPLIDLMKQSILGSSVALAIAGYVVGICADAVLLHVARPLMNHAGFLESGIDHPASQWVVFYRFAPQALMDGVRAGYENMVRYRLLTSASIALFVGSLVWSIRQRTSWFVRISLTLIILAAGCSLYGQWNQAKAACLQFAEDSLTFTAQQSRK